jgi:hypothetical protein
MQINMLKNRFSDVNRSENKVVHALVKIEISICCNTIN